MSAMVPTSRRCPETRAHYAHEWYSPLRQYCPGGPEEPPPDPAAVEAVAAVERVRADALDEAADLLGAMSETFLEHERASIRSGMTAVRMLAMSARAALAGADEQGSGK